ncbi:MAG: MaoC family dehydratase N-terminal domain-containing protein [Candidatus Accumulibacter contiguus]
MDMDKEHPFDYLETMGCDLGKMLHGEQSFVYHKPVYSGDTLTSMARSPTSTTRRTVRCSSSSRMSRCAGRANWCAMCTP